MKTKSKIPALRFKGFTDAWEQRKLGEISKYSNGGSYENDVVENGTYELITLKSVNMSGKLVSSGKFINRETKTLEKDTLVMILSEQAPGLLGMTAQIPENNKYVLNQRVAEIKPNTNIDSYFLSMSINRSQVYFSKRGAGTKVQNISKPNVENFEFYCPSEREQQKIGSFFKQLDETIALHQRKLDLLKEQKKGFLQKMFPKNGSKVPELRFAGFADDWEERKLGDVTTWTKGQGLTKEDLNKERDGSEAVHYADLYKFSPVMHEVIHWTNSDDGQIIPDNSLLFPASDVTPVGLARTSTLRLSGVKAGGDVIIGQLDESINSSFMSYQINANSKKILPLITGTTVKHIQAKSLATVSVSITNMAEQTAIAGIFEQLDETIALHQRKLDLLKEQKKGYLQKMFPKNGEKVPELRFAGFADDWEERKLGEVATLSSSKRIHLSDYVTEGIPFYRGSEISTGGITGNQELFISQGKFDEIKEKYGVPSEGDILVTAVGTLGNLWKVDSRRFYYKDGNLIQISKMQVNSDYLLTYFTGGIGKKRLLDSAAGSNQKALTMVKMREITVDFPSEDEQKKIGAFFKSLDDTIALHQRKLDLLKEQKKGFLQKMFV